MSAPEQSAAASDEVQLVERARAGDLEAFEELLGRHQQRVMRVVLSILKEPMDAEEVAQDVFLTVFEKIDHFRGDSSFSTWLHRVAVNAALMRRRKSKADRRCRSTTSCRPSTSGDISRWISPIGRSRPATQFWPGRPGR